MKGTHMSIKDIILPRNYRQLYLSTTTQKEEKKKQAKRKKLEITERKNKISDLFPQLWLCSADL